MTAKFIYFNAARNFYDTIFMYAQFKKLVVFSVFSRFQFKRRHTLISITIALSSIAVASILTTLQSKPLIEWLDVELIAKTFYKSTILNTKWLTNLQLTKPPLFTMFLCCLLKNIWDFFAFSGVLINPQFCS